MRKAKSYYSVFALKDGTVWFATEKRKPRASRTRKQVRIDEDGIFEWYIESPGEQESFTQIAKIVRGATLATRLNLRRTIREMVQPSLVLFEERLRLIEERLDQLLQRLPENIG